MFIFSFNPHNFSKKLTLLLIPFYKKRKPKPADSRITAPCQNIQGQEDVLNFLRTLAVQPAVMNHYVILHLFTGWATQHQGKDERVKKKKKTREIFGLEEDGRSLGRGHLGPLDKPHEEGSDRSLAPVSGRAGAEACLGASGAKLVWESGRTEVHLRRLSRLRIGALT